MDPLEYPRLAANELEVRGGDFVYLGTLFGHYGHFLLESLPRWWGLSELAQDPKLRFVVHPYAGDQGVLDSPLVRFFFSTLGIERDRLVSFSEPTRLARVIVPEPTFRLRSHVHAKYRALLMRLVHALGLDSTEKTEQPLYLSRSAVANRSFPAERVLEQMLTRSGCAVIHPERLSLREQIERMNRHRHIIGIMGSAMHSVVLSSQQPRMINLAPSEEIFGLDYLLTDACADARPTYIHACEIRPRYLQLVSRLVKAPLSGERPRQIMKTRDFDYRLDLEVVREELRDLGYIR